MTDEWTRAEKRKAQSEQAKAVMDFVSMLSDKIADLEKENAEAIELTKYRSNTILKLHDQLAKAKEIMNIAIEGIKNWGIVGGNERPFEKQADMLFNLFLEKSEQFLKEIDK